MNARVSSSKRSREGRLVVMSPHLDDAAFSTATLIARRSGAIVATAFAGRPPCHVSLTPWDAACGFKAGDDVVGTRRREDRAAMNTLGATPLWLEFLDSQYGETPPVAELARALDAVIVGVRAATVAIPLGLFHSDHRLVHDAGLVLAAHHRDVEWLAYEDVPYRRVPALVDDALRRLHHANVRLELPDGPSPSPGDETSALKRRAIACYRSQLRGLGTPGRLGHADALAPERYWRLLL